MQHSYFEKQVSRNVFQASTAPVTFILRFDQRSSLVDLCVPMDGRSYFRRGVLLVFVLAKLCGWLLLDFLWSHFEWENTWDPGRDWAFWFLLSLKKTKKKKRKEEKSRYRPARVRNTLEESVRLVRSKSSTLFNIWLGLSLTVCI